MLLGAESAWAGISGSKFYFRVPSAWTANDATFAVYFFGVGTPEFSDYADAVVGVANDVYVVDVPSTETWTKLIVVRYDPDNATATPSWTGKWNQTGNIDVTDGKNFIYDGIWQDATSLSWGTYAVRTIAFDKNSTSWGTIYAYGWTNEGSNGKYLGDHPGVVVAPDANGICKITFAADDNANAKIQWNNGGTGASDKTSDLAIENEAVYNKSGKIANHTKGSTNVTGKYYSTFYAPYNVTIPTKDNADEDINITAYTGEYNDATSTLTLHALTGVTNVIPGGKAVILKASTNAAYSLKPTTAAAGTAGTNSLRGLTANTAVDDLGLAANTKACVLGVENGVVGFYGFTGTLGANKAYLVVPYTAAPTIRFEEDEATDIHNINANESAVKFIKKGQIFIQKNGVVYDVTGRAVK